jgi:hypothetical protein
MPPLPDIANASCAGEYDIGRFGYYIRNPAAARVSHALVADIHRVAGDSTGNSGAFNTAPDRCFPDLWIYPAPVQDFNDQLR